MLIVGGAVEKNNIWDEDYTPEFYKCECGEEIQRHIFEEGARYHVLSWHGLGKTCSEKTCEINHECKPKTYESN